MRVRRSTYEAYLLGSRLVREKRCSIVKQGQNQRSDKQYAYTASLRIFEMSQGEEEKIDCFAGHIDKLAEVNVNIEMNSQGFSIVLVGYASVCVDLGQHMIAAKDDHGSFSGVVVALISC